MTESEALIVLEKMTSQQFNHFLKGLPERVGMLVRSGMCNWREVLPQWYIKSQTENAPSVSPLHGAGSGCPVEMCNRCFEKDNK